MSLSGGGRTSSTQGLVGFGRDLDVDTGLGTGVMVALRLWGLVELSAEGTSGSAGVSVTGEGRSLVRAGVEKRVIGGTLEAELGQGVVEAG